MSNLVEFAANELNRVLKECKDSESLKTQKLVNDNILEIVKTFSEQEHSSLTAAYSLGILQRVMAWKPITELTGEDNEWEELGGMGSDEMYYQNKRCPSVFKTKEGRAFYTEGKVFTDDGGKTWYTTKESIIDIQFPFEVPNEPEKIYLDKVREFKE